MRILVIGSLNFDYTFMVERLPEEGETILARDFSTAFGGKGANQAVACSRLGGEVCMIGAIGNDSIGKDMLVNLKNNGVDISGIRKLEGPSGMAVISVNNNSENTIVVNPGVNNQLTSEHIEQSEELIKECDIILIQLEIPMSAVESAIGLAHKWGKKVILNPAPATTIKKEILEKVYLITPNKSELFHLTGEKNIIEGVKKLLESGVEKVIVTLGSKGCIYMDKTISKKYNPWKVNAIDPTAAGDTFNAAMAVSINKSMDEAVEFASKCAALATTKIGAQTSIPFLRDVEI
ncbi:ribokinase [Oceanirhabdus sp. W0125-5]|uniref:ribokinase n=1 Tax=Oceanirhabdus sp. W0125-5 TaxID=2999116 RepID=UPI0022F325E4|nr:ribokinase [Oceanirhabdus sp. W0125-5]WBW99211.1 ribokinase [Oceanirhabdus sp. W0125-5]